MFKVGDVAVYPAHGVGVVEAIESKEISGKKSTFYVLRILDNDMTIMIPTNNIDAVGLRAVIAQDKIPQVYKILKEKNIEIEYQTWNRRYREYSEKIKTGSVFEIAEVLRNLNILKLEKELSFGERRMLDMARTLLIRELAIAKNMDEEDVELEIKSIFDS